MSRLAPVARVGALVAVIAVVVAACGGSTPSTAATAGPLPSGSVAVEASDQGGYRFTPSTLTVPEGTTTFVVKNGGSEEHEFEIFLGDTVVDEIEGIVPGLTKELPVTLLPGEYTFVCKLNGHDLAGMKGTLTVTAK